MGHMSGKDLLSPRAGVNADHGHSNGPGGIAYGHLKVRIAGLQDNNTCGVRTTHVVLGQHM